MQITTKIIIASAATMAVVAGGSAAFAATDTAPKVTAEKAIELAQKQVPGSWVCELDFDGGIRTDVWEVKVVKGDVVHELDFDAASGKLLKKETEPAGDDDGDDRDDD